MIAVSRLISTFPAPDNPPAQRSNTGQGKIHANLAALAGGAALGFDFARIVAIVNDLTPKDFYKSMTTHADHRVWQDGYRPTTSAGKVYLKLTVFDDVLVVSFKEL